MGDSIDMRVALIGAGYEAYQSKKDSNTLDSRSLTQKYSQEQLQGMLDRVRNDSKNNI